MRGEGGAAGEGSVVGVPKFHSSDKCTMSLTNINSYVQRFLWPVNYIVIMLVLYFTSWGVTRPSWSES